MNTQQGNISLIIAAIIGIVLLGGAYIATQPANENDAMMGAENNSTMTNEVMEKNNESDSMMIEDDTMMQKDANDPAVSHMNPSTSLGAGEDTPFVAHGTLLAGNSSPLLEFNETDFNAALQSNRTIVLYFYASWCPTCKAEFPLMQQAFDDYTGDNIVGFRVHYNDNQTTPAMSALAKQHGVAYQHTKVLIKNGQRVHKSPESWSTQDYLNAFAQY